MELLSNPGHGLRPSRVVLPNGLVLLVKSTKTSPAVSLSVALRAGSAYDPAGVPGVSYFLSRVIDRGTERRSADEIAEDLDDRGVSLGAHVTRHGLSLNCTCLSDDFAPVLDLLADIVRQPTCPDVEIQKRRGEILTSIRQDEDNPAVVAIERVMALLYGADHPYGRPSKGTIATVEQIDRRSLLDFHRRRFAPALFSVAIVGDVDATHAIDVAASLFGDWEHAAGADAPLPPVPRTTGRRQLIVPMMSKPQADIAYGFTTIVRSDPAYYAYWVMNNIFGQYGLGGRLGESIRERQGMAYYAFSSFDANVLEGPLVVRAGVAGANVDRALASIDREVERMAAEGPTESELADTKQYLIGAIPRTIETNSGIATFLQTAEFFGLGLDHDTRLPGLLGAVTLDDAREAARRALAVDRAAVVVAGPYDKQAHGSGGHSGVAAAAG
jgi:zinc protease